jgi:hypothetical protein
MLLIMVFKFGVVGLRGEGRDGRKKTGQQIG